MKLETNCGIKMWPTEDDTVYTLRVVSAMFDETSDDSNKILAEFEDMYLNNQMFMRDSVSSPGL